MDIIDLNDLTSLGQINDLKPYLLPPEAFTDILNMRFTGDKIERMLGWAETMTPSGGSRMDDPHFTLPLRTDAQTFWVYASLDGIFVFDGLDDHNITNVGGAYSANSTQDWNGTIHGGVVIMNNGVDPPQAWLTGSPGDEMVDLPNWPADTTAKIVRSFGPFLMAFNITESGNRYPHMMMWSSPADPGAVPSSWDYTDPATSAGRQDMPDVNSGEILEAMMLGDTMFIYKRASVWKSNFIGGQSIFSADQWLEEGMGILAPRCVCLSGDGLKHVVVTQDDIIIHNGSSIESILTDRQKESLFAELNRDASATCFIFRNAARDEIWFCYPTAGETQPTKALVWNYKRGKGAISFADGITFRNAITGDIEGSDPEQWNEGSDLWDDDTGPWSEVFRRRVVLSNPVDSKLMMLDSGNTRDGVGYRANSIRQAMSVVGRKRNGEWIVDHEKYKMVDAVWPKAEGAPFNIRVGFQELVDGPVTWQDYTSFNPATDMYINAIVNEDLPGSGRAISFEFSTPESQTDRWALAGYKFHVGVLGQF